jgi:hypothetical protein
MEEFYMAGFIKGVEAKKIETSPLNTKINKEVFDKFKIRCLEMRYPMNVVLEIFMQQYTNGRFDVSEGDVLKWKKDESEVDTLNTTFNKEIYVGFKSTCKSNGYFVKYVITAFMEKFASGNFALEYVTIAEIDSNKQV